jgi:DNA-binding NarL/FixJ family response regulator
LYSLPEEIAIPRRLLIADDHEVTRMGVRMLLAENPQWEVCGEAIDGHQAIEKVMELAPDAVLLDLSMPVMNGFEVAAEIRRLAPSTKIIFFSMHDVPATAQQVGGDAFVKKADAAKDLVVTLERVLKRHEAAGA